MNVLEIIDTKKLNHELSKEQIRYFIDKFSNNEIADYQASALLMAIRLNGMNSEETFNFTQAMIDSGEVIKLPNMDAPTIDKHSTGGVGDKTSLILMPLLAAFGFCVPKMSGRGLGHTGGTLDKLEVFNNFTFELSQEEFIKQLQDLGIAIIGQSANLVPADKKIYALRDVTGTVDSIPLIASSIMAKKIAAGAQKIILDIKCGSGAFMETYEEAHVLAETMVEIGKKFGVTTIAHITPMDAPLGRTIGNSLEISEAIECLQGNFVDDKLKELIYSFTAELLVETNYCNQKDTSTLISKMIKSGEPLAKFKNMVIAQGSTSENFENIPVAQFKYELIASKSGYINKIDAHTIGICAMNLGAGRKLITDDIDATVGIELTRVVGDFINEGDLLANIYYNDESKLKEVLTTLPEAYNIDDFKNKDVPMILGIVK